MERYATLERVAQPEPLGGGAAAAAALGGIDAFLARHPEIEASPRDLAVPRSCRAQFYQTLADARARLVSQAVGEGATQAQFVIDRLSATRQHLAATLGLRQICLPPALQAFCDDPILGSSQPLLSSLLSYVQGNVGASELLQMVALAAKPSFEQFSLAAYEAWMAYEAICQMKPKRAWAVEMADGGRACAVAASSLEMGRQHYHVTLRLPEAVFECEDGIYAVKFELASEVDFYDSKPQRRRDFSSGGDTRGLVGRRYLLVYKLASLDAVPAVADRDREFVLPPHALFGVVRGADLDKSVYALGTVARVRTLAPRRGAFFLALDDCADRFAHMAADHGVSLQARDATFDAEDVAPFAALMNTIPQIGDNHEDSC